MISESLTGRKNMLFMIGISVLISFSMSMIFYKIQRAAFENQFLDALKNAIPNYKKLIYNQGQIRSLNADHLITYDDFSHQEFKKENGKIVLSWKDISEQHGIPEQTGAIKKINLDNVMQLDAFDRDVFTIKDGKVSLDVQATLKAHNVIQDVDHARTIDTKRLITNTYLNTLYIDLKTGLVNHFSNLGNPIAIMLDARVMKIDENWRQVFAPITRMNKGQILPLALWTVESSAKDTEEFMAHFADLVSLEKVQLMSAG